MSRDFDFIVAGGGSAGAVVAARLSEGPTCRVALVEAGDRPPMHELMPAACADLQLDPETDWMYTADPGKAGRGLIGRRMPVPRGKMLGGSSGMNSFLGQAYSGCQTSPVGDTIVRSHHRSLRRLAPTEEGGIRPRLGSLCEGLRQNLGSGGTYVCRNGWHLYLGYPSPDTPLPFHPHRAWK